jgi:S-methylmethionine-dependent homocysteine/selenocysteine methylase
MGADGKLVGFDFPLVPFAACLDALLPFAPDGVAIMHTPVAAITPALDELRARWAGPLGAYPEIGEGAATAAVTPDKLAAHAGEWLERGVQLLGGCCGTRPEHIRALVAARDAAMGAAKSG